jgi:hypothetical protein
MQAFSQSCSDQLVWQLSDSDKYGYACLRAAISANCGKSQRNRRVTSFTETLEAIRGFVAREDKDDPIRSMLCGVCWLPEGIAVNTHQLRRLVAKCKSSINGSLQKIGYTVSLGRAESAQAMTAYFPLLKDNSTELRKWTVRRREDALEYTRPMYPTKPPKTRSGIFEISLEGLSRPRSAPAACICANTEMQDISVPDLSLELPMVTGRLSEVLNDNWELPNLSVDGLNLCYDYEMAFCDAGID